MVKRIDFKKIPEIGTVLMIEGQRYVLIKTSPYQKANGLTSSLLYWESYCPDCGAPFATTTSLTSFYITRRCKKHRKPGRPVADTKTSKTRTRKGGAE